MKVDSLDRSILNVLRDSARSSFVEIADRVGVTERTIRTRMKRLEEEGVIIPPTFLMRGGKIQPHINSFFIAPSGELTGDFAAQAGANQIGVLGLSALSRKLGRLSYMKNMEELNEFAERVSLEMMSKLSSGTYHFEDCLDDDGYGSRDIKLSVNLSVDSDMVEVDFRDCPDVIAGNVNCPDSVAAAAAL